MPCLPPMLGDGNPSTYKNATGGADGIVLTTCRSLDWILDDFCELDFWDWLDDEFSQSIPNCFLVVANDVGCLLNIYIYFWILIDLFGLVWNCMDVCVCIFVDCFFCWLHGCFCSYMDVYWFYVSIAFLDLGQTIRRWVQTTMVNFHQNIGKATGEW